jgi:hypothetical protein
MTHLKIPMKEPDIDIMAEHSAILRQLGADIHSEGMRETPRRAAIRVPLGLEAPVRFPSFWKAVERWEGRDFQVGVKTAGKVGS